MSVVSDDSLIVKFRSLFPDKSRRELKSIFIDMTKSVYKNVGKDEKMSEVSRNRWGAVTASLRSLNLIEFKIAMYRFKSAGLTFEEIRRVFIHLDTSGNGRVEYDEFLAGIRGELSMFRQRLVIYIFRKLDRNSSGFIEESELAKFYKSSNLPEILDGEITPKAKSKDFVQNIGTVAVPGGSEGRISVDQFIDYYLSKSLVFTGTDEEFRAEVLSEWRVETESRDNSPTPTLCPPHPEGKHPAPPSHIAPSSSQISSPRGKKVMSSVSIDDTASEPEDNDAHYRLQYAVPSMPATQTPKRSTAEDDHTHAQKMISFRPQSPHVQNRFSPPLQQPQPRHSSSPLRDQAHPQNALPISDPIMSSAHQQQQLMQHYQSYPVTPQPHHFVATARTTDQVIFDNLNSLMISLQHKVYEQQSTIESQQQVMISQQQMLNQQQMLLDQQRQQAFPTPIQALPQQTQCHLPLPTPTPLINSHNR